MTHVITQHCCNDAACVDICPVNCIHPGPDEAGYATSEMLYIDPNECIDCGACADVCPVGAIVSDYDIEPRDRPYIEINAAYFRQPGMRDYLPKRAPREFARRRAEEGEALRVAIVGSGPAGCYTAEELLKRAGQGLRLDMFERLPVPWGLARSGVAPDHLKTKDIVRSFERALDDPRLKLHLNVEIGRDITHADVAGAYDAVVYAYGALSDRRLGIAGEDLPGSHSATEFAAWYNGHPDFADHGFDLDVETAVILGNGNVALDAARVLASDMADLRRSDIAEHALEALSRSRIQEIIILGRRGPLDAAFTLPELLGLRHASGVTLWTDLPEDFDASGLAATASWSAREKLRAVLELPRSVPPGGRSVRLSFFRAPTAIHGQGRAEGVRLAITRVAAGTDGNMVALPTGEEYLQEAGLVLRSIGYRGQPIPGLPFEESLGRVPHEAGRVRDPSTGEILPGVYVAGWIKRGSSGVMGTNKACARETVSALLEDFDAGRLRRANRQALPADLPKQDGLAIWRAIDRHERDRGKAIGRPRVKIVQKTQLLSFTLLGREGFDA